MDTKWEMMVKIFIAQGVKVPWYAQKNVNTDLISVVSASAPTHHI